MGNDKALPPVAYLTIISMVSPIALNILLPALPDIAVALNATTSEIQLSLTLYLFSLAVGQLLCAPLADRFGRRLVLLIGIAIHFIGCLLGATAADLNSLLLARLLQALGGCTGMVLARTILLDKYARDKAAGKIGYITLAIALSQAIAPALGGYINLYYHWQALFYASLLLSSLSWLIVLLAIPETAAYTTDKLQLKPIIRQYITTIKMPDYLGYTLSTTFIACGFYLFIGSAPYIVQQYIGDHSVNFGNWFLWVSFGFMFGSYIAALVSAKYGVRNMILVGHCLCALGAVVMLTAITLFGFQYVTLFLPMALFTIGRGCSQPNSQSAGISTSQGSPSMASGLTGFIQLTVGTACVQVTPFILAAHPLWVIVAITLCPVLAFIAYYTTARE